MLPYSRLYYRASGSFFVIAMFVTLTAAIGSATRAASQSIPGVNLENGLKAFRVYDGSTEKVSLATGNLVTTIPLLSLPQRGDLTFAFSLVHNSQHWTSVRSSSNAQGQTVDTFLWTAQSDNFSLGDTGWHINTPLSAILSSVTVTHPAGVLNAYQTMCVEHFTLTMGDGSVYGFPAARVVCQSWEQPNDFQVGQGWVYIQSLDQPVVMNEPDPTLNDQNDGGLSASNGQRGDVLLDLINGVVKFKNGTTLHFQSQAPAFNGTVPGSPPGVGGYATSITDRNGNSITATTNGDTGVTTYLDTLGRTISFNGSTLSYKNSSGTPEQVALAFTPITNPTVATFPVPASTQGSQAAPRLTSVSFPSGLTYAFVYNQYGEITKISYPSGGYSRFVYSDFSHLVSWGYNSLQPNEATVGVADAREVVNRYECSAPVVAAGTTQLQDGNTCTVTEAPTIYAPITSTNYFANTSNSVTDPLGNLTYHAFLTTPEPVETLTEVYQGSSTPLQTTQKNYSTTAWKRGQPDSEDTTDLTTGRVAHTAWNYFPSSSTYSGSYSDNAGYPNTYSLTYSSYNPQSSQLLRLRSGLPWIAIGNRELHLAWRKPAEQY